MTCRRAGVVRDVCQRDRRPAVKAALARRQALGSTGSRCSRARPRRCSRSGGSGCAATGPWASRGEPRWHWEALARLTEPLEAAVAGLHHGDDVRYRRAGRQAAAIVLQHCADTGRSWWGWTPWEWARLCGGSAREFVAAQPLPTEPTVRPFVVALAYLLGGFTDFHRLGTFNRLHLACLIFGEHAVEESLRRASEVLDRWGYRARTGAMQAPVAGRVQPGPADSTAAPGSTTWTPRRSPRCGASGHRRRTRDRCCMRCSGWSPSWAIAIRRCAPATTTLPSIEGADPAWARLDRALARHLDTDPAGPRHHPHPDGQDRAVAGRRAPRDHRARPVDQGDLCRLGRRGGPDDRRRLRAAPGMPRRPRRHPDRPAHQGRASSPPPARSSATARNGSGSAAGSTRTGRWPCRAASPP